MVEIDLALPQIRDGEDKSSLLGNRIRKNYKHVRKWAKRSFTNCFRIYDWEIGKYPLAIDFYAGRFLVHYFPRSKEGGELPEALMQEITQVLYTLFGAPPEFIYWRSRIKRKKIEQYEKIGEKKEFFTVLEYGVKFWVNLSDYLDTGLFLDHRETRKLVSSQAQGKRVLNLFAYTCSFSVHAALQGASYTKSVDMSNTYTQWGKENFLLNALSLKNNEIIRADCLPFLDQEIHSKKKYDLIIIDPPTLSRSKKMQSLFDVQVDYISLILKGIQLLSREGILFFSTNFRKFAFDPTPFEPYSAIDISEKTLPLDFHDSKIHRCWKISAASTFRRI